MLFIIMCIFCHCVNTDFDVVFTLYASMTISPGNNMAGSIAALIICLLQIFSLLAMSEIDVVFRVHLTIGESQSIKIA